LFRTSRDRAREEAKGGERHLSPVGERTANIAFRSAKRGGERDLL